MTDEQIAQSEPRTKDADVCRRCNGKPCPSCDGTGMRKENLSGAALPVCTWCYNEPCPDCGGVASVGTFD